MTLAEEIQKSLTRLFPDKGETGDPPEKGDPYLHGFVKTLDEQWDTLPEAICTRVHTIETNFNSRGKPFSLHIQAGLPGRNLDGTTES